jgi:hypothetical protein
MDDYEKHGYTFMSLPAELRVKIYGYLLSADYTRMDGKKACHHTRSASTVTRLHTMKIGTLSQAELTRFHSYRFHTQIIGTSKDISREASFYFAQQHLFVTFRCSYPGFLIEKIEDNLLPLVAKCHTASRFSHHTTVITLRPWRYPEFGPVPVVFTFLGEYLPAFVTMLLVYERTLSGLLKESALTVGINQSLDVGSGIKVSGDEEIPPAQSIIRKLLEPLCGLHSVKSVKIIGPVSDYYVAHITASITKRRPTAEQTIAELFSAIQDARKTSKSGEHLLAMSKYKAVIRDLWRLDTCSPKAINAIVHVGEHARLPFESARAIACFRMAFGLAYTYLKLEKFGEAHKWARAALEPYKDSRIRYAVRPGNACLTGVCLIAAKASEGRGLLLQARVELEMCLNSAPGDPYICSELRRLNN